MPEPRRDVSCHRHRRVNGQPAPLQPPQANGKHERARAKPPDPQQKPAAGPLDRDTLLARLLDLVSERTGYPKEALSIDLDLEADLGVDSIKRVEMLGALAETIEAARTASSRTWRWRSSRSSRRSAASRIT